MDYTSSLFFEIEKKYLELCFINRMVTITDLFKNLFPFLVVILTSIESNQLHILFELIKIDVIIFSVGTFEI